MVVDVDDSEEYDDMAMWADTDDEEATYMFLASGCNQTCHGEFWMKRFRLVFLETNIPHVCMYSPSDLLAVSTP